jgi:hypothetical protein
MVKNTMKRPFTFLQHTRSSPCTACAFAGYLCSDLPEGEGPSPSVLILGSPAFLGADSSAPSDSPLWPRAFVRRFPLTPSPLLFPSPGRVGTVDPFGYGVSPSPNRTCTFPCIRLSILVLSSVTYLINSQHSHDHSFGLGHKDCLSSPQRLAFDRVTTSYTLADPDYSGCSTHYRQTLGTIETPSPYRWVD